MITIFNRRELLTTFSMAEQAAIRELLADNDIDYYIKTINRGSASFMSDTRSAVGAFGQKLDLSYEYIIYVRRADYEHARSLLG